MLKHNNSKQFQFLWKVTEDYMNTRRKRHALKINKKILLLIPRYEINHQEAEWSKAETEVRRSFCLQVSHFPLLLGIVCDWCELFHVVELVISGSTLWFSLNGTYAKSVPSCCLSSEQYKPHILQLQTTITCLQKPCEVYCKNTGITIKKQQLQHCLKSPFQTFTFS